MFLLNEKFFMTTSIEDLSLNNLYEFSFQFMINVILY